MPIPSKFEVPRKYHVRKLSFSRGVHHAIVLGDSRLWNLHSVSWSGCPFKQLSILSCKGAVVSDYIRCIDRLLSVPRDQVMTVKIALGGVDILRNREPADILGDLISLKNIITSRFPKALVAITDVAMVNVERYEEVVGRTATNSSSHYNNKIEELNRQIFRSNCETPAEYSRGGATPFLAQSICRSRRRRCPEGVIRLNRAQRTYLPDGIHLTKACLRDWARSFVASFRIDARILSE